MKVTHEGPEGTALGGNGRILFFQQVELGAVRLDRSGERFPVSDRAGHPSGDS